MTSLKSGIRLVFTSATSPWAMRRLVASPLAETPSYWVPPPCRIRVTISSDVSANFTLILQPVAVVKGVTQSTRSEEHTSELQSRSDLVCRLLLEKKKKQPDTQLIVTITSS